MRRRRLPRYHPSERLPRYPHQPRVVVVVGVACERVQACEVREVERRSPAALAVAPLDPGEEVGDHPLVDVVHIDGVPAEELLEGVEAVPVSVRGPLLHALGLRLGEGHEVQAEALPARKPLLDDFPKRGRVVGLGAVYLSDRCPKTPQEAFYRVQHGGIADFLSVPAQLVSDDEDGGGAADESPPVRHSDADEIGAVGLAVT